MIVRVAESPGERGTSVNGNDRAHDGADLETGDDVNGVTGTTPTSTTTTQELSSDGERETHALKKMLQIGKVLRAALAEIQDGPLESCDTSISSIVNDRRFSKRDWGEASKTACEKKFERKVWGALDECDAKQIFKMCGLYFKRSWKKSIVSPSFAFLVGVTSQFCQKELGWATDTALDWAQVEGNKKKSKTKKGTSPLNEPVPHGLDIIIHVFFRLLYCTPEISKHVQSYVTAQRKRFTYHTKTQAQVLARALNSTFGVNLELLEFLGVTKENLEAAEYNPHDENGEIVQVRVTEDKLEPFAPATVLAQTKASLFNWTEEHSFNTEDAGEDEDSVSRRNEKSELAMAILMMWTIEQFVPYKEATKLRDRRCFSVKDFFEVVHRNQLAFMWSLLLRQGHGRKSDANKKQRSAHIHSMLMFEKCRAWVVHWYPVEDDRSANVASIQINDKTFDLWAAAEVLDVHRLKKRHQPDSPQDENQRHAPSKRLDFEDELRINIQEAPASKMFF